MDFESRDTGLFGQVPYLKDSIETNANELQAQVDPAHLSKLLLVTLQGMSANRVCWVTDVPDLDQFVSRGTGKLSLMFREGNVPDVLPVA